MITGPDGVDAAWFTRALRASGAIAESEVVSFDGVPIGTGQVGHNVRYQLVYDRPEPGAPASVVAKFPSPDETSRSTGVLVGTYDKEARFYDQLASEVDMAIPRCHLVEHDAEARLSTLLFDDLAPAVQGDQIAGCGPEEASLVVDQMPGLHVPFWGQDRLRSVDWLPVPAPDSGVRTAELYRALWPGFVERYGDRISPELRALGERFGNGLADWAARRAEGPFTLVHGDLRLDNVLFGPDRSGALAATVVDWQTVAVGIGTDDLAYFVGSALSPAVRRDVERDLVARYHRGLVERGVDGYSWEQCWDDYRRFSLSGLQMAVVASMIVRSDERGDTMFLAMAERHTTQAIDLGADELL